MSLFSHKSDNQHFYLEVDKQRDMSKELADFNNCFKRIDVVINEANKSAGRSNEEHTKKKKQIQTSAVIVQADMINRPTENKTEKNKVILKGKKLETYEAVKNNPGIIAAQIAKITRQSSSAVSDNLALLEADNFIERKEAKFCYVTENKTKSQGVN